MTDRAVTDEQAEVVRFLSDPASYPDRPSAVERIDTHGAMVFLAGDRAWKIKRAVRFPYMDLSTLEKRRAVCAREVEINRTWAPEIYVGCVPITREADGRLALNGVGEVIEWAVEMRRFPQSDVLGSIAAKEGINRELARSLADMVVDSHTKAQRIPVSDGAERFANLAASISANLEGVAKIVGPEEASLFRRRTKAAHARAAEVLSERARQGFVRRCHGDLHLDNVVLWRGRPTLFDAIEFDEELATIDTLYDLAFLLMDLDCRGLRPAANVVLNRYLSRSREPLDLSGLAALPLFLGLRAGVRALVAAERAEQDEAAGNDEAAAHSVDRVRRYMRAALAYLDPPPPEIVAVGGLSGTGKSTLAAALAPNIGPCPGAVHLRSDVERKALFGIPETERLSAEGYAAAVTERVYDELNKKAKQVLEAGHGVVVDAVFARENERKRLEAVAEKAGVALKGLWLTASFETMMKRVAARRNDASDATVEIVRQQAEYDIGTLSPAWRILDANDDAHVIAERAARALSDQPPQRSEVSE